MNLTKTHKTLQLQIEFTTYCNLRCIYCCTLSSDHKRRSIDLNAFDSYISELVSRKLQYVSICGYGEVTTVKNWQNYCNKLIDLGINLQVTSNLAKELTEEEVDTFSRCTHLNVSCDTVDLELFKYFRKGADFKTLLYNITMIRALAYKNKRLPPQITFFCVVTDRNVFQLNDLVSLALSIGVKHFHFCNFCKHDIEESAEINPIADMSTEHLVKIEGYFQTLFSLIEQAGGWYHYDFNLLEDIKQKLNENSSKKSEIKDSNTKDTSPTISQRRKTRDCLLPWSYIYISSNGEVRPCCILFHPVGNVTGGETIDSIINNEQMLILRNQLLEGNLKAECLSCPEAGWITIEELKRKVEEYILTDNQATDNYLKHRQNFVEYQYDPLELQRSFGGLIDENQVLKKELESVKVDLKNIKSKFYYKIIFKIGDLYRKAKRA